MRADASSAPRIRSLALLAATSLAFGLGGLGSAQAFPDIQRTWDELYAARSQSGTNADCQLCHVEQPGTELWNGYGWDLFGAFDLAACDLDMDGVPNSNSEAIRCIETVDSDRDPAGNTNLDEILESAQPGWTPGPNNAHFDSGGLTATMQLPPEGLGELDPPPIGTTTTTTSTPTTTSTTTTTLPGRRRAFLVRPGQSIQAAIDAAPPGSTIRVLPGVYRESADETNALTITKSGIRLIGLSNPQRKVILEPTGSQRNGIVVTPPIRQIQAADGSRRDVDATDCMSCHTSMAPPFPLTPMGELALPACDNGVLHDFEIEGITIRNFPNNGLFPECIVGFRIEDVHSVDNKNYGIFPINSANGIVTRSSARGADDSGIWVETSNDVVVSHNVAEDNVIGFEVSNSQDIVLEHNVSRNNTAGMGLFILPGLTRDESVRWTVRNNQVHDNNRDNTGTPGALLSFVPSGSGILVLGVDDSVVEENRLENNDFFGIAVVDYCLGVEGTDFDCRQQPPDVDPAPQNNRIVRNVLVGNGRCERQACEENPLSILAADLVLATFGDQGNCWLDNEITTLGEQPEFPPFLTELFVCQE